MVDKLQEDLELLQQQIKKREERLQRSQKKKEMRESAMNLSELELKANEL